MYPSRTLILPSHPPSARPVCGITIRPGRSGTSTTRSYLLFARELPEISGGSERFVEPPLTEASRAAPIPSPSTFPILRRYGQGPFPAPSRQALEPVALRSKGAHESSNITRRFVVIVLKSPFAFMVRILAWASPCPWSRSGSLNDRGALATTSWCGPGRSSIGCASIPSHEHVHADRAGRRCRLRVSGRRDDCAGLSPTLPMNVAVAVNRPRRPCLCAAGPSELRARAEPSSQSAIAGLRQSGSREPDGA